MANYYLPQNAMPLEIEGRPEERMIVMLPPPTKKDNIAIVRVEPLMPEHERNLLINKFINSRTREYPISIFRTSLGDGLVVFKSCLSSGIELVDFLRCVASWDEVLVRASGVAAICYEIRSLLCVSIA